MAKKIPNKKIAKKAVRKTAAKKTAPKAVEKVAEKPAETSPAKKATRKVSKISKKPSGKKIAAKKISGKAPASEALAPEVVRKVAKKAAKRAPRKKAVKAADLIPIVVKRPYVRPEKLAHLTIFEKKQRQRLLDLRDQITDSMYGIQSDTIKKGHEGGDSGGSGQHMGDAGSDSYDRDFALTLLSKESNALGEIEEALQRLEMGIYGICEQSGAKIPHPRLEAMPFARLTVECQAAKERNESLSDHSSRDYGFN